MSLHDALPGFAVTDVAEPQPTAKQLAYARSLATRHRITLPADALQNRLAMSRWIQKASELRRTPNSRLPSSKQVAFAERIARLKRREIPQECFRDKTLLSRWIDGNKPR